MVSKYSDEISLLKRDNRNISNELSTRDFQETKPDKFASRAKSKEEIWDGEYKSDSLEPNFNSYFNDIMMHYPKFNQAQERSRVYSLKKGLIEFIPEKGWALTEKGKYLAKYLD